jgi:nucleoside-diphosphate-sugar epimerase
MSERALLITGGCGYLGAHLLREIAVGDGYAGSTVRILDNLSSGSVNAVLDLPSGPRYELIEADILSPGAVRMALEGVVAVIHLAALVRTPFAFDQPASVQQVNHWGTVRLIEHCREAGVQRFVYASSASVYGPGESFEEAAQCRPIGPYSCSKLSAEHAVLAANGAGLETAVLRLGTLYGGEAALARFDAVANRLVYLAGTGRSLTVFGNGEQARPLVHVRDAARALIWALRCDESAGGAYNVVEENVRVESLAHLVAGICPGVRIRYTDQDYREHLSLAVNGDKLRRAGWAPRERLVDGLEKLVEHFHGLAPVGGGRATVESEDAGLHN